MPEKQDSRRGKKGRDTTASKKAGERGFRPDEFESADFSEVVEAEKSDQEFEDFDIDTYSLGVESPTGQFLPAKQELERRLLLDVTEAAASAESGTDTHGFENIVGVGISEKVTDGDPTGEPCVTVYVVAKVSKDEVDKAALVPEEINGIPTDVVSTGQLDALPHKGRYRPAPGGVSIGHFKITAGTLGCLVRKGRTLFVLSNNHVLANTNSANIGDPILQPGPIDGGIVPRDVIAKLSAFIPINFGGAVNKVDCAIGQTSPTLVTPLNKCFGKISAAPLPCRLNLLVKKCGRTTQFTRGRITDCNATVRVNYGTAGAALFQNQIIIQSVTPNPFSLGGDSGSLITTDVGNRPVGLLFAGSPTHTIANPISAVLAALGVAIVA